MSAVERFPEGRLLAECSLFAPSIINEVTSAEHRFTHRHSPFVSSLPQAQPRATGAGKRGIRDGWRRGECGSADAGRGFGCIGCRIAMGVWLTCSDGCVFSADAGSFLCGLDCGGLGAAPRLGAGGANRVGDGIARAMAALCRFGFCLMVVTLSVTCRAACQDSALSRSAMNSGRSGNAS